MCSPSFCSRIRQYLLSEFHATFHIVWLEVGQCKDLLCPSCKETILYYTGMVLADFQAQTECLWQISTR